MITQCSPSQRTYRVCWAMGRGKVGAVGRCEQLELAVVGVIAKLMMAAYSDDRDRPYRRIVTDCLRVSVVFRSYPCRSRSRAIWALSQAYPEANASAPHTLAGGRLWVSRMGTRGVMSFPYLASICPSRRVDGMHARCDRVWRRQTLGRRDRHANGRRPIGW